MPRDWKALGLPEDSWERQEAYRHLILEAGEAEFAARGFASVTARHISDRAGLSHSMLRSLYTGKRGVWDGIHSERMTEMIGCVQVATSGVESPVDSMFAAVRAVSDFFCDRPGYLDLLISQGFSWGTADLRELGRGEQGVAWAAGKTMLASALADSLAAGQIDVDGEVAAGLVISALQVWLTTWALGGRQRTPDEVANSICAHLEQVLSVTRTLTASLG